MLEDEEEELAGLSLRDLGEHVLKDFDRAVRLYQLVVPDLQIEFPPLRTGEAKTPFGGREGDLAEAVEAGAAAPIRRRYRRPLLAGAAVLIAAGAAALGLALSHSHSSAQPPVRVVANSLAEVDPQKNAVVADVRVGDTPTAVVYGLNAAWVSNTESQTVSKVDPRTLAVQTVGVPGRPADIEAASGHLFVAELAGERLFVLGPSGDLQNTIRVGRGGVVRDFGVGGLAVANDRLWAFESRRGVIVHIDPANGTILKRTPTPAETILAFALATDGLWATTLQQDVLRIDPSTGHVLATIPLANALNGVAAAGDKVWVAAGTQAIELEEAADVVKSTVTIAQQGPGGGDTFGKGLQGIVVDGNDVWVTDPFGDRVVRIDARTGTVTAAIPLGHTPAGLAVGGGRVWVAVQA